MKNVTKAIMLLVLWTNSINAQLANIDNDDLSFLISSDLTDPEKEWPDCESHLNIRHDIVDKSVILKWDTEEEQSGLY